MTVQGIGATPLQRLAPATLTPNPGQRGPGQSAAPNSGDSPLGRDYITYNQPQGTSKGAGAPGAPAKGQTADPIVQAGSDPAVALPAAGGEQTGSDVPTTSDSPASSHAPTTTVPAAGNGMPGASAGSAPGVTIVTNDGVPGTAAPATGSPTSATPTTGSPTSNAPPGNAPTANAPASGSPTSNVPTVNSPTSNVPTAGSAASGTPTADAPTSHTPTVDAPTSNTPTPSAPAADAPAVNPPATNAPTADAPVKPGEAPASGSADSPKPSSSADESDSTPTNSTPTTPAASQGDTTGAAPKPGATAATASPADHAQSDQLAAAKPAATASSDSSKPAVPVPGGPPNQSTAQKPASADVPATHTGAPSAANPVVAQSDGEALVQTQNKTLNSSFAQTTQVPVEASGLATAKELPQAGHGDIARTDPARPGGANETQMRENMQQAQGSERIVNTQVFAVANMPVRAIAPADVAKDGLLAFSTIHSQDEKHVLPDEAQQRGWKQVSGAEAAPETAATVTPAKWVMTPPAIEKTAKDAAMQNFTNQNVRDDKPVSEKMPNMQFDIIPIPVPGRELPMTMHPGQQAVGSDEEQLKWMREHNPQAVGGPFFGAEPTISRRGKGNQKIDEAKAKKQQADAEADRRDKRNKAWQKVYDARDERRREAEELAAAFVAESEKAKKEKPPAAAAKKKRAKLPLTLQNDH